MSLAPCQRHSLYRSQQGEVVFAVSESPLTLATELLELRGHGAADKNELDSARFFGLETNLSIQLVKTTVGLFTLDYGPSVPACNSIR